MTRPPRHLLVASLGFVVLGVAVPSVRGAEAPPPPPAGAPVAPAPEPATPEEAADAVAAALVAKDEAALKARAAMDDPDPWLVADELLRRGQHDAADAFSRAAPRVDTEALPAYVASRRGLLDDAQARERLATGNAAIARGDAPAALSAFGEAVVVQRSDVVGVRLAGGRGLALASLGRVREAAAALEAAAQAAERLGWTAYASMARHRVAAIVEAEGEPASAADAWAAALALDARRGLTGARAPALARLGGLLLRIGELERAAEVFEQAVAAFEARGDTEGVAKSLGNLGAARGRLGQWSASLQALERALALFEEAGDGSGMASALTSLVVLHRNHGQVSRAHDACVRLLALLEQVGDAGRAARVRLELGSLQQRVGDFAGALATFELALRDATSRGDASTIASATAGIGNARARSGDYAAALSALQRAQDLLEAQKDREGAAAALRSVAGIQFLLGDHEASLASYQRALARFEALDSAVGAAHTLGSLGNVQEALGDVDGALATFRRAVDVFQRIGDPHAAAGVLINIGTLQAARGEHAEAIQTFERARDGSEQVGDRAQAASALLNIGLAQAEQGEGVRALATLERALPALEEVGDRFGATLARGGIGRAHLELGDAAKALTQARRAVTEASVLATGLGAEEGAGAREGFAFLYDTGTQAALAAEDAAELTFFLESSRAGALLEGLRAPALLWLATVPEGLRAADAEARAGASLAARKLAEAHASGDRGAIRAARAALEAAEAAVSAVVARIQREAKSGAAIVAPEIASLAEIRATLADGDVLVLYGEADGEACAVVATKAAARLVRLGSAERLAEAAAALELADSGSEPAAALARMRELAVDPLGLDAKATRLLLSPTGALAYVPFATLIGGRDVILVPSGTTYRLLLEEAGARGTRVLALGDPDYTGRVKLQPLPATAAEARAVGDVVLTGRGATERGLREELAKQPRWRSVHLACHGLLDEQYPMRSSLALTAAGEDDGLLTALDVFRLRTPADLVVLSACETGRGRVYVAEGIVGLTRAFMFAGAPRVICSLWKVDDEATAALMMRFYELWNPKDGKPGLPTAEALRRAQEHVRSQEKWRHPHFWAAWVLWGLPS